MTPTQAARYEVIKSHGYRIDTRSTFALLIKGVHATKHDGDGGKLSAIDAALNAAEALIA